MVTAPVAGSGVDGLVVAITGATGGIGEAVARHLVAGGARVALGCHPSSLDEGRTLADDLGSAAVAVPVDVTDTASVEEFASACAGALGPVDGLVANAGVMESADFADLDEATWSRTLDVNLHGTYRCLRAFAGPLSDRPRASIVSMASQMAYVGGPGAAAYCASKAGILGLTRAAAHDLAPRVRVNAVAPGPIETPMTTGLMTEDYVRHKTQRLAMRRFGSAEEVAPVVTFLLGDGATYVTGQTYHVNGGGVMP